MTFLQGHLNSGLGCSRGQSKDGSSWWVDGGRKRRVWVLWLPICGKDTHSALQQHKRSWLSMYFCKPCFWRSRDSILIYLPPEPCLKHWQGSGGVCISDSPSSGPLLSPPCQSTPSWACWCRRFWWDMSYGWSYASRIKRRAGSSPWTGEGALLDGTHITVAGRWGMWSVIVPPLHRCPASLWFRKTRSEQSVEGRPLPPQSTPLHGKWSLVGHTQRLFVYCVLNRHASRALIDTGSTISIVRPGILP